MIVAGIISAPLVIGGVALGLGVFTFAAMQLFSGLVAEREEQKAEEALVAALGAEAVDAMHSPTIEPAAEKHHRDGSFTNNELINRAVDVLGNLAARRGILGTTERMLQGGDLPIRPAEALFFYVGAIVLIVPIALIVTGDPTKGLLALVLVAIGPPMFLRRKAAQRAALFAEQLPEMLTMLAGSLRAGRSLGQALESVAQESENPMGRELKKIVAEVRLGWPLADAMGEAAERLRSDDFGWAVTAIKIQSEVGGNLSELLESVAGTMRERSQMQGEVRALTAEGRASAIILTFLPIGMGAAMYMLNPEYIGVLFETSVGKIMLAVAASMITVGYLLMKKLVKVDV